MADAAAECSARMQRHSHGRNEGDEAPRNRHTKAAEKGLGCAEIQRPRQAMDAGAPVGGRLADAAAAFSAGMQRHSRGRSEQIGGARTQCKWSRRQAVEAAEWRRIFGDGWTRRRGAGRRRFSEEAATEEAATLGMRR